MYFTNKENRMKKHLKRLLSLMMAVLWSLLQSPDLAITEAAVGAGVTSILFFLTLKKIHALKGTRDE